MVNTPSAPSVLAALFLLGALCACPGQGPPPASAGGETEQGVVILRPPGSTVRIQVEVARKPEERERGLMFRKHLEPRRGMLFVFEKQDIQTFWMKNTYIPLDMVFIDDSMQVVGVVENAEPLTTTQRKVDRPARYVLELKGGTAKEQTITPGTPVQFEGIKGNN